MCPNYDYECEKCGYAFEKLHDMKTRLKKCPRCKELALIRLIGKGSGLIFKGNGFYCNDYPKEGKNE